MTTPSPSPTPLSTRRLIRLCRACELAEKCSGPVPPDIPDPLSRVLVLGEAPGQREDRAVVPFVGPSGQLARRWVVEAASEAPEAVWANAVCCWPHGTPELSHVLACRPNLDATWELVRPTHVLAFGGVALDVLRPGGKISEERGRWFRARGAYCLATWHPAAVLRNRGLERQARGDVEEFMFYARGVFDPEVEDKPLPNGGVRV